MEINKKNTPRIDLTPTTSIKIQRESKRPKFIALIYYSRRKEARI